MSAEFKVLCLAGALLLTGIALLLPTAQKAVAQFPRHRLGGIVLTCIAMAGACWALTVHPIDFLAFLSPTKILIGGLILTPLICIFLENLLCARALGGILMLWPMPVILATRDYVSALRLIPITIGYISLTLGMIAVFHPWTVRVVCEYLSENKHVRLLVAISLILASMLCVIALCSFGKVVGQ